MSGKVTLVIGAAASGKSAFAEQLVAQTEKSKVYIATARVLDDEMSAKVVRHKTMRGAGWHTIEEPLSPERALAELSGQCTALIDCATMWLMNHMMDQTDLDNAEKRLLESLAGCKADCVIVTNELGGGIVPSDRLSRGFRQAQGELNQHLAAQADTVINVIAGLPQVLKGSL